MPRPRVTAKLRTNPRWSPRRIAHTPNWQVNEDATRMIVAGRIRLRTVCRPPGEISGSGLSRCGELGRRPDVRRRRDDLGVAGPQREVGGEQARRRTSPRR